jgi:beta-lactamase class A
MQERIEAAIKDSAATWSMVVKNLKSGEVIYQKDPGQVVFAASVQKVSIATYLLHQVAQNQLELNSRLKLAPEHKLGGTGVLEYLHPGLEVSLGDLLAVMLIISDNTATKMLVKHLGAEAINKFLAGQGLVNTALEVNTDGTFSYGHTTAAEMAKLLESIYSHQALPKPQADLLVGHMMNCHFDLGIKRYLTRVPSEHRPIVASKQGTLDDLRHEVGIVFGSEPLLFSIFSSGLIDSKYEPDNPSLLALAKIGATLSGLDH